MIKILSGLFCFLSLALAVPAQSGAHEQIGAPLSYGLEERLGAQLPLQADFTGADGETKPLADWIEGPTLILPVYYRCRHVCNRIQEGVASVLEEMRWRAPRDFRILSLGFDPQEGQQDARRSRSAFLAAAKGATDERGWEFLTGQQEAIRAVLDAAGYRYSREGEDFLHPVVIFAVSGEGKIVRYLHGTRYLSMDLTMALLEAKEGRLGRTIQKVVAFCFSYDPQGQRYVFNILRVSAIAVLGGVALLLLFLLLGGKKRSSLTRK